jgi:hypothetical protein
MEHSESIIEIAKAMNAVQKELTSVYAGKVNPFFHSKYADLKMCWDSCQEILTKNGLCVLQPSDVVSGENVMETILLHTSGEWISGKLKINPVKNDPQSNGSAVTYARRYGLASMIMLTPTQDDNDAEVAQGRGGKATDKKIEVGKPEPLITPEQITKILSLLNIVKIDVDKYNQIATNHPKYTFTQAEANISFLDKLPRKNAETITPTPPPPPSVEPKYKASTKMSSLIASITKSHLLQHTNWDSEENKKLAKDTYFEFGKALAGNDYYVIKKCIDKWTGDKDKGVIGLGATLTALYKTQQDAKGVVPTTRKCTCGENMDKIDVDGKPFWVCPSPDCGVAIPIGG